MFSKRFFALGLVLAAVGTPIAAHAQLFELQPHADLQAQLPASSALAPLPGQTRFSAKLPPWQPNTAPLFNEPPTPERGWEGLANALQAIAPNVDTSIPPSAQEITRRLQTMIDAGRHEEALSIIERQEAQRLHEGAIGTDVQLMFLKGRALSGLGRQQEAIELYQLMTTRYPELPEPWNNLAVAYAKQNRLAMAADALQMALTANPKYTPARQNLAYVQLLQARETLAEAAQAGSASAAAELQRLEAALASGPAR